MSPGVLFRNPERMQSEISDLQYKAGVHHAVAGRKVAV